MPNDHFQDSDEGILTMNSQQHDVRFNEWHAAIFEIVLNAADRSDPGGGLAGNERYAPPFNLLDILVTDVILSFFVGIASGVVTEWLLDRANDGKGAKERAEREKTVVLCTEILKELRKFSPGVRQRYVDQNSAKVHKDIVEILVSEGWSEERAFTTAEKVARYLNDATEACCGEASTQEDENDPPSERPSP